MTLRTRARTLTVLPALGLLTWTAAGCHSEVPSPVAALPAATTPVSTSAPTPPPVTLADPSPIPAVSGLNDPETVARGIENGLRQDAPVDQISIGAQSIPVSGFEPVEAAVPRVAAAADSDLRRTAQKVEVPIDALAPPATPAAPAPESAPIIQGVQSVADEIKADVRQSADRVTKGVAQEIRQTTDGLKKKALDRTQQTTQGLVKKFDQAAKDAIEAGLKKAKDEVAKQIDQAPGR